MRLTTPAGLVVRAVAAVTISVGAFVAGVGVVVTAVTHVLEGGIGGAVDTRAYGLVGAVAVIGGIWVARKTIREERRWLLEDTAPVGDAVPETGAAVEQVVERTAAQFDVPAPSVRVHPTETPLAYTTRRPGDPILGLDGGPAPVIVVSEGLVSTLPGAELDAVLAHELAHVANDDLRLLPFVLVPLVAVEKQLDCASGLGYLVFVPLAAAATAGVSVFARGRELAADRAAAAATGDPGALAAAIRRLDASAPAKPSADLRERARSLNAINVLPTLEREGTSRLRHPRIDAFLERFRSTHPPLQTRLEHLRSLADD